MKLTALGSGTFFINETVTASSFLLEIGGKKVLIDCGPGTLVKLAHAGFSVEDIDYVFITHYHPDHTADLFPLFMNYRLLDVFSPKEDRKFPTFFGPKGIENFISKMAELTQLNGYKDWGKIKFVELEEENEIDDFKVFAYKVIHRPFNTDADALSFRFEHKGKVLSYSGDTSDCKGVRNSSKNSDLFVCDMSFPKSFKPSDIHMNTTEVGQISKDCDVKKVLVYHLYPQFDTKELVCEVQEVYKGEILVAKDLESYEI